MPRSQTAYNRVYERIRRDIHVGLLPPGSRLPSTRGLSADLGLARGTVETAYQMLVAEGYAVAHGAAGTFVARDVAPAQPLPRQTAGHRSAGPSRHAAHPLSLQLGLPALDAFPRKLWARIVARAARRLDESDLAYADPQGSAALRQAIASHIALTRGVECDVSQIFVTAGTLGGLALAARVLLSSGDAVLLENPGFFLTRELLTAFGAKPVGLPVDGAGARLTGAAEESRARLAVLTPTHQFPLGIVMTVARRLAMLDWARHRRAWIIEDDYDSELHYSGPAPPALKSLDGDDRVIYAGTFSKILHPGLRIGYLVVPGLLRERFAHMARLTSSAPPVLTQHAVADFMGAGQLSRHVGRMRRLYLQRRDAMLRGMAPADELGITILPCRGGLHLALRLPRRLPDKALVARLRKEGLGPAALSAFAISGRGRNGLLVAFANTPAERSQAEAERVLAAARRL